MKFRQKLAFLFLLALSSVAGTAPPLCAQNFWIVASPELIDPRLSSQIDALARTRHVKVSYLHVAAGDLKNQPGKLIISLETAASVAAFQADLGKAIGKSDAPLSAEIAAQGYSVSVSATDPGAPQRIRISAATPTGFHNALLRLPEILTSARSRRKIEFAPPAKSLALKQIGRAHV